MFTTRKAKEMDLRRCGTSSLRASDAGYDLACVSSPPTPSTSLLFFSFTLVCLSHTERSQTGPGTEGGSNPLHSSGQAPHELPVGRRMEPPPPHSRGGVDEEANFWANLQEHEQHERRVHQERRRQGPTIGFQELLRAVAPPRGGSGGAAGAHPRGPAGSQRGGGGGGKSSFVEMSSSSSHFNYQRMEEAEEDKVRTRWNARA